MAILPVGIGPQEGGYQIERSLRFNSADSAYLNRTPGSAGNRQKFTIAGWLKLGRTVESGQTDYGNVINAYASGDDNGYTVLEFHQNTLRFRGWNTTWRQTTQVFRDASAWYFVLVSVDTTQATAANRIKMYVNGAEITAFSTNNNPSQNANLAFNSTGAHRIGQDNGASSSRKYDGYMAEFYLIDGSALDPTSFGEYNSDTGVWKPKAYTGSYGTNGFYLDFADNSSTTALGYDAAGSNDWTPNNFSVTAGAGNDSLVDTPTPYGTDTGAGGEVRGNYCTLNPLQSAGTLSNGNLDWTGPTGNGISIATMGNSSGKWYWECNLGSTSNKGVIGVVRDPQQADINTDGYSGNIAGRGYALDCETSPPKIKFNGTATNYGTQPTATSDILMVALDLTNNSIFFGLNGTWFNSSNPATNTSPAFSSITAGTYFPFVGDQWGSASSSWVINFGQRPFAYTAPSGFKALCTQNLPEPTVVDGADYFNATLWTGNGSTQTITTGIANDLVWTKDRGAAYDHTLFDVIRTPGYFLRSNATSAEEYRSDSLTAFTSTGFSVGADSVRQNINKSGNAYVSWAWKAGGTGVSNTAGTITGTVTVSANTTAGFSIVTYTGNGTSGATVGHGLGAVPKMLIVKNRSDGTRPWAVYHASISGAPGNILYLNSTSAANADNQFDLTPTPTVFSLGSGTYTNKSGDSMVCYAFAPVEGYSAFGSYTGNGSSDGPFVYTGFKPKFLLVKKSDGAENWIMLDGERNTYNVVDKQLLPNTSDAEGTITRCDFLSNGFKVRAASTAFNSGTMIYAAFAENPFKYSLAR